jgi:hypothetical protein
VTDWETDLIQQFRNHSSQTQIVGTRQTATGPSLYMARSIQITNPDCLACHSTPDAAPVSMTVANDKARKILLTVMGLLTGVFFAHGDRPERHVATHCHHAGHKNVGNRRRS